MIKQLFHWKNYLTEQISTVISADDVEVLTVTKIKSKSI